MEVGDRVVVVNPIGRGKTIGEKGTVVGELVGIADCSLAIKFDTYSDERHSLGEEMGCPMGHGYFCSEDELEVLGGKDER